MGIKKTQGERPPSPPPAPKAGAPAAPPAAPALPDDGAEKVKGKVYSDGFALVNSTQKVSPSAAKAVALRAEEAYRFDEAAQHWDNPSPLGNAVTIKLMTPQQVADAAGSTRAQAVATDDHTIVVGVTVSDLGSGDDDDILAHELSHVQDSREAGKRIGKVPHLIQEGKAWILGEQFGWSGDRTAMESLSYTREELKADTAAQAYQTFHPFIPTVHDAEPTAALFVEFLRTHLGGEGFPDAVPKLAKMIEQIGAGSSYEDAFQAQFGVKPAAAEADFMAYLKKTEGNPVERFRGTLYDLTATGDLTGKTSDGRLDPKALAASRQLLGKLTEADARLNQDSLRSAKAVTPPIGDEFAALYLEFLRTRLGGKGVPDAADRLARVFGRVAAEPKNRNAFETTFEAEFGMKPKAAETAFFAYVKATEGNPAERFRGTIYEAP